MNGDPRMNGDPGVEQSLPGATNGSGAPRQIIAVLGAGSWGTALAHLAALNGHEVRLWTRDAHDAECLTQHQENVKYLPGVSLTQICVSSDLRGLVDGAGWIVSAVPCAGVPALAGELRHRLGDQTILVSGTKGLHPESGKRAAQVWEECAEWPLERYVALSGPNLAREIAGGVPTSTVVASPSGEAARRAQELFNSRIFRVYTNTDLVGVELPVTEQLSAILFEGREVRRAIEELMGRQGRAE